MDKNLRWGQLYEFLDGTQWRVQRLDFRQKQVIFRRFAPTFEEIEKKIVFNFIKVECKSIHDASRFFDVTVLVGV